MHFFASLYGLKGKEQMSGGMKRRLNIACGIAHSPKLIIMDESTVGVDTQSREHILNSIKTLRERGATIISTYYNIIIGKSITNQLWFTRACYIS